MKHFNAKQIQMPADCNDHAKPVDCVRNNDFNINDKHFRSALSKKKIKT